ncbi:transporter [Burkholderia sp. WAC0059]|uniref:BON domain-containing protein n=1 Tax=Burkholderia sp. WAC0059 TaxID=2066022 RepID=UPI000C7F65C4|nr:BON domain-containing protein [Burkholderia sp. WAC0059]PLZ00319.1 transporter [Burkholderia sp. WAC0059]
MKKRIPLLSTTTVVRAAQGACLAFACALTALAPAGAFGQTDTSSAPAAGSESIGQHVSDATITTRAKANLLAAQNVKSQHIHVRTRSGAVWLTGSVPSAEERDAAAQIVQNVSGVQSVKNNLRVRPSEQ